MKRSTTSLTPHRNTHLRRSSRIRIATQQSPPSSFLFPNPIPSKPDIPKINPTTASYRPGNHFPKPSHLVPFGEFQGAGQASNNPPLHSQASSHPQQFFRSRHIQLTFQSPTHPYALQSQTLTATLSQPTIPPSTSRHGTTPPQPSRSPRTPSPLHQFFPPQNRPKIYYLQIDVQQNTPKCRLRAVPVTDLTVCQDGVSRTCVLRNGLDPMR
ncbi:hypothetical protein B0J14DRAFT_604027 [Halenospora varia]|nr:hypothetical protein B0J14DRAFT_604027 [Halenospora varia]